jgi:transcriptional regulator with XRE-family HTH domain
MQPDLSATIGVNVRRLRAARLWSLEMAAHELGLKAVHLAAIERGVGALTLASLQELAARLEVPVSDLATERETE